MTADSPPTDSPTGGTWLAPGPFAAGAGHTRPAVSMIEDDVEVLEIAAPAQQRGGRFAARTGFDPRPRAEARENPTYCARLVRSSQATPTETAKAAARPTEETR